MYRVQEILMLLWIQSLDSELKTFFLIINHCKSDELHVTADNN